MNSGLLDITVLGDTFLVHLLCFSFLERIFMRPLSRRPQGKAQGAHKFRRQVSHTKRPNIAPAPQRGGYRL